MLKKRISIIIVEALVSCPAKSILKALSCKKEGNTQLGSSANTEPNTYETLVSCPAKSILKALCCNNQGNTQVETSMDTATEHLFLSGHVQRVRQAAEAVPTAIAITAPALAAVAAAATAA